MGRVVKRHSFLFLLFTLFWEILYLNDSKLLMNAIVRDLWPHVVSYSFFKEENPFPYTTPPIRLFALLKSRTSTIFFCFVTTLPLTYLSPVKGLSLANQVKIRPFLGRNVSRVTLWEVCLPFQLTFLRPCPYSSRTNFMSFFWRHPFLVPPLTPLSSTSTHSQFSVSRNVLLNSSYLK